MSDEKKFLDGADMNNLNDPDFGGFSQGVGGAPIEEEKEQPTELSDSPKPNTEVISNISERLTKTEEVVEDEGLIKEKEAPAFDLTSLTAEQLSTLKQMLNATPDRLVKKKGDPIVTMRKLDDKFIVKFKKAYQVMVLDEELQRKVPVLMIPVLFYGEEKYVDIRWDMFHQNAERVKCRVTNILSKTEEIFDGTTISRATGTEVEMYKTVVHNYMTVELPNVGSVDVEAEFVNA